ncbi:MAG: CehA/McbA family metallohydrolase, partial [Isosphaeraceae bacterium]
MRRSISPLQAASAAGLVLAAACYGRSGADQEPPRASARLNLTVTEGTPGRPVPARVYLLKDGKPFRLSPVDVLLPLKVDLHYRERLWRRPPEFPTPDGRPARTLEVTHEGESHFVLLDGEGRYELPAGRYRVEAYRGLSWVPAAQDFELKAGQDAEVSLALRPLPSEVAKGWVSGDDHIHLTRAAEDDPVFLAWLRAEDLSVGNFLQLQRQADAAVQYGFGRAAEARSPGYSVRSGEESRSEFYGHINLLGPERIVRPLSVGSMYANSPPAYPYPARIFSEGRSLGAVVGYAHFDGSMTHSTLPLDLALGNIDFVEVFQFGLLKTDRWYELLNAGFRVTGIAGSDFPANLSKFKPWP